MSQKIINLETEVKDMKEKHVNTSIGNKAEGKVDYERILISIDEIKRNAKDSQEGAKLK